MAKTHRRPGLAVLVAVTAIGLAGCSRGSTTPQVASLGTSTSGNGSGNSATTPGTGGATGNPAQFLNEWTGCMRSHGDPEQTNPTVDTNKVIHITVPSGVKGLAQSPATSACQQFMTAASTALGGNQPAGPSNPALVNFAKCMRANGVPRFPDPTGNGFVTKPIPGTDLDPNNPVFQNANKLCKQKTGFRQGSGTHAPSPGTVEYGVAVPVSGPGANG